MDFDTLRAQILACTDCAERFGFTPHPVVVGNQSAKILQISQAPSRAAHQTRKPFDDQSGRRLRQEWYQIGDDVFYNPDNFYITAIAHCFPGKAPGGGDRPPPVYCANKWLAKEIQAVDSQIILLIGGNAAKYFFPGHNFTSLVFSDQILHGKPTYILPHPSPLNMKWLRDHPAFLTDRLPVIRAVVHSVLFGVSSQP